MCKEMVCIVCPMGCRMSLNTDGDGELRIEGNSCPKGRDYALNETTNPVRMLQSTVVIEGASLDRLPVRTSAPIPKEMIMGCMEQIKEIKISAPVRIGDIIMENVLRTGVDIIASRSMFLSPVYRGEIDLNNESSYYVN